LHARVGETVMPSLKSRLLELTFKEAHCGVHHGEVFLGSIGRM